MKKKHSLCIYTLIFIFSIGCYKDVNSNEKHKDIQRLGMINLYKTYNGDYGYMQFKMDDENIIFMNCIAHHDDSGAWSIWGKGFFEQMVVEIGDATIGEHDNRNTESRYELLLYSVFYLDGSGKTWFGSENYGASAYSKMNISNNDNTTINGIFSGVICDQDDNCSTITDGEFEAIK